MNVIVFGATGMVGQGVLRECLLAAYVKSVLAVGRTATGVQNPKLRDLVHSDLCNYESIKPQLTGFDACFFCLGVTSSGMTEEAYERVTYGITVAAAKTLCPLNPEMTFIFVSGAGSDSTEHGKVMWARIKGKAENAVMRLPFASSYAFRPAIIQPLYGARSKTTLYHVIYSIFKPLFPILRRAFPDHVLTTQEMGQAMLNVARDGYPKRILESKDIHAAAK
jgi:uncharacterized protein YbjT (DUF2867 family)